MALGATPGATLKMILWQGTRLTLIGVVLGLAGAFGLTRLMQNLLYDVNPTDPVTFVIAGVVVILAALSACVIPALRASRLDPIVALRGN